MKKIIKNLITKGVNLGNKSNDNKIVITTSFILLLASLVAFGRFAVFLYEGNAAFYLISLISSVIFYLIYVANTKGYHTFAKYSLILIGNLATGSKELISGGTSSQIYLILASYGVVFLLFNIKDYWKIIFALLIPITNTIIVLFFPNFLNPTPVLSLAVLNTDKYVGVISNIVISVAIIWYFVKQSDEIELKLNNVNELQRNLNLQLKEEVNLKEIAILERENAKQLLSEALDREIEINHFRNILIAKVSHEYKNPLTVINNSMFLLENYFEKNNKQSFISTISNIEQSIHQLNSGMSNLLAYSKIDSLDLEVKIVEYEILEDINSIIREVKYLDKSNKHQITVNCLYNEFKLQTDPNFFYQIAQNLIQNAVKYSPNGGKIIIDISSENDFFIMEVSDSGIGISEDDLKNLTKPFKRGSNVLAIKGTGIGLTIVKNWVELLKGKLEISSKLGIGSKFKVTLPMNLSV